MHLMIMPDMSSIDTDILRAALHSQTEQADAIVLRDVLQSRLQQLPPEAREAMAEITARALNETLKEKGIPPLPPLPAQETARLQHHLKEMQRDGITLLGPVLNPQQVKETRSFLDSKPAYAGHVWTHSDRIERPLVDIRKTHAQACYKLDDTLQAPHLLETMSSPFVLKLVEQYLGCTPTIYQANLAWSFHNQYSSAIMSQGFHHDWDNFRFCVLFVYMTDIDKETGPHQFARKSHTLEGVKAAIARYRAEGGSANWVSPEVFYREGSERINKYIEHIFRDDIVQIEQPAGYAFLADAFGLHRGAPIMRDERLLFWARYGLYDNGFSADVAPNGPVADKAIAGRLPNDATHRYIFRGVLKSEFTPSPPAKFRAVSLPYTQDATKEFGPMSEELLRRFGRKRFITRAGKLIWDSIRGKKLGTTKTEII